MWDRLQPLNLFGPKIGLDNGEHYREPVFLRTKGASLSIDLQPAEAQHLKRIARSKGVKETSVVRQWILDRLQQFQGTGRRPNEALQRTAQKRRRR